MRVRQIGSGGSAANELDRSAVDINNGAPEKPATS